MRLQLILPTVEPTTFETPTQCRQAGCGGRHLRLHQTVAKALRDTRYPQVTAQRYQCWRCRRTFRVYPQGVSRASTSQRVKGIAVMLYLLGLSYGAVALALAALGLTMSKTQVYDAVQAAASRVPDLKRQAVFDQRRTAALGADLTSVKCGGAWLPLGVSVDAVHGFVLTIDELAGADATTLHDWLAPIAASVGATLLVTDDADAFKTVAKEVGLPQQVCKSHVVRNTDALITDLTDALGRDDGSLAAIGVTPQQAEADLADLARLIRSRQPAEETELERLHRRYLAARSPGKDERATLAYRLRLLFLDRWNLWRCLTRYRTWRGPKDETVDGTNNATERGIGWWIKERYRPMRGYKRPQSAVNVSRLLAWCGNQLTTGGADLASLIA